MSVTDLKDPSSMAEGNQFPFPVLQNLRSEAVGLFLIQVEDLDTEVPSSVAVRMEYLFCLSILML